jgi:LacI family transcriptional regulator
MSKLPHSITIQDVARSAGVSVSTISRVLNNKADVSLETQEHVKEVIQSLGYTSNLAARSMRSLHTNIIGVIVPDIEHPFSHEVLKGINRVIASSKYDLLVYTTGSFQKQDTAQHEQQYVSRLNGTITDGVIVVTPSASTFTSNAPIVSIDPHVFSPEYPTIFTNHYQGAVEVMRYLIGLNHSRIAYISGRPGLQNTERYKAYCDELEKAGIVFDSDLLVTGDYSTDSGESCARSLLSLPRPPSAIFAANDQTALGVLKAAKTARIKIPQDLSLVGFDNIPETQYCGLTTVDQSLVEMGRQAVELLINLIEDKTIETHTIQIAPSLVIRESCQVYMPE